MTDKSKPNRPPSDELAAVEKLLSGAFADQPPHGLRNRVLSSIVETSTDLWAVSTSPNQITWLQYVAGLAAAIVLWANLSFGALHQPLSSRPRRLTDLDRNAILVCKLLPELTADECRSLALRYTGGTSDAP